MAEYHVKESCNKCSGVNSVNVTGRDDGHVNEARTTCTECGHEDYWAYGHFESGTEMVSMCRKY